MLSRDVKVGLFVFFGFCTFGLVIYLIGEHTAMFSPHTELKAAFQDVQGLSRGSPVRMGGVDIGRVVSIQYARDPKDPTIFVQMSLVSAEAERIREDSVASVEGKGMLGDKMVVITPGLPEAPRLPKGRMVKSKPTTDMADMIRDLKSVASGANVVVANLEKTTNSLADERLHQNVKDSVARLASILEALDKGDGYVGRLLHDKAEADRLSATLDQLRRDGAELEGVLASTKRVIQHVETGPGLVHHVLYEKEGEKAVAQFGSAADELALALHGVREKRSLAHELLYEEESGKLVQNLSSASDDLRLMMADLRQGKGTLGALMADPSVYEDIKVLLGNVGRNRSLRALVRYSIAEDEALGKASTAGSTEAAAQANSSH